jgi:hypothetical protein
MGLIIIMNPKSKEKLFSILHISKSHKAEEYNNLQSEGHNDTILELANMNSNDEAGVDGTSSDYLVSTDTSQTPSTPPDTRPTVISPVLPIRPNTSIATPTSTATTSQRIPFQPPQRTVTQSLQPVDASPINPLPSYDEALHRIRSDHIDGPEAVVVAAHVPLEKDEVELRVGDHLGLISDPNVSIDIRTCIIFLVN